MGGPRSAEPPAARFPLLHHAAMLADRTRLSAYRRALTRVIRPRDTVVDLGTGTGILAGYAAGRTRGRVFAIEYFPRLAQVAEWLLRSSRRSRVQVLQARSFDVTLQEPVDVIVTETIGLLGPEENIVEMTHDFCHRHRPVRAMIPAALSLWAQPIESPQLDRECAAVVSAYFPAAPRQGGAKVARMLEREFCSEIRWTRLTRARATQPPVLLSQYELGRTQSSEFRAWIDARSLRSANAVHFYFEALLCEGVRLSTRFDAPLTHWTHSYIRRPPGRISGLEVHYRPGAGQVEAAWR